jgi:modulator of FtsH protease HflC
MFHRPRVLLKRKFSDRLRSEIGRLDVKDIVTDSRGKLMSDVRDALNTGTVGDDQEVTTTEADDAIASAAARVEKETTGNLPKVNPNSMAALGIEVDRRASETDQLAGGSVQMRFTSVCALSVNAVARASHFSGSGRGRPSCRLTADYEVNPNPVAEAERTARITRGDGDAEAAKLFANAFSQDPDFYAFIRSLRAYEASFKSGNQDVMVLSPDSDFFRFMKSPEKTRK